MSERGGSLERFGSSPKAARLEEIALRVQPFLVCAARPNKGKFVEWFVALGLLNQ